MDTNCILHAVDWPIWPICKIPNVLSPKASIPFSVAFRTFSLALKKGEWDIFSIWKFFLEQKSGSRPQKVFTPKKQPKNKTVRKLLLRGRYGSGKNALFSSDLAPVTDETVNQLVDLHPAEFLNLDKPSASQFWKQNPLSEKEVETAIFRLPSGKAPGPSGITFDMLKSVCRQNAFIIKDLCSFFQDVLTMKIVPPKELSASRLVALTKPNGKVRPIAIGEAIYRLMSSVIFNRVSTKAKEYFFPFQYRIKTIDGASVAALTSDLFFNCHENSCIFNLDFKNAFNSVKRDSIWKEIKSNFPELETFFL
ncbi:hypothetical protein P9112_007128 [Eukaryota sp. TZLM1-RC]